MNSGIVESIIPCRKNVTSKNRICCVLVLVYAVFLFFWGFFFSRVPYVIYRALKHLCISSIGLFYSLYSVS